MIAQDDQHAPLQPGRACPLDYRYEPAALARAPDFSSDALYVVGGLYGNAIALDAILNLAEDEVTAPVLVFNGDFNWFNIDAEGYAGINERVLEHVATRGNVETELASERDEAGCGCAYPQDVSDGEVERSNAIMRRLRETARRFPALGSRLGALPMHCVVDVAGVRVAIVHGDAESLAGWTYAERALSTAEGIERVRSHLETTGARVIASTHTCLPVAVTLEARQGACALINNGAAGMPNFRGTRYGVATRIAPLPRRDALYGARIGRLHVEAFPVYYDHPRWMEMFLANWPRGSPAHASYFRRLTEGPCYERTAALRSAVLHDEDRTERRVGDPSVRPAAGEP
jgi:hypothetical protein